MKQHNNLYVGDNTVFLKIAIVANDDYASTDVLLITHNTAMYEFRYEFGDKSAISNIRVMEVF